MKGAVHFTIATLCFFSGLLAQSQITVAVLGLESQNIIEDDSAILTNRLQSKLCGYATLRILGRDHSGWIRIEKEQSGAHSALSMQELGGLLNAQIVVGGILSKSGESNRVEIWAIDVETGEKKAEIEQIREGDVEQLLPVMEELGAELAYLLNPSIPKLSPFRIDQTSERLKSVAVSDFKGYGLVKAEVTKTSDELRTQLGRTGAVDVLEKDLMNNILNEQDFIISEPIHLACAVDVGELFAVDYIVVGSIGKIGSTYTVDLQVVDLHTESLVNSYYYDYRGQFSDLISRADIFARELIGASRRLVHFPRGRQPQTTPEPSKELVSAGDKSPPDILIYEPATASEVTALADEVLKKWGDIITPEELKRLLRQTEIARGMKKISQPQKILLVEGRAFDESGIFQVLVNGQEAGLDERGNFLCEVRLKVGENKIYVRATDIHGNESETSLTVVREGNFESERDDFIQSKYIALIIGIDSYSGEWPRLKNAVNDAKGVKEILESQYQFDSIITLFDQQATEDNIIQQLEWLTKNVREEDNLLIYYSGHGELNERLNKGFWVPVDARTRSVAHYIPNSLIQTFLGGIRSRHTLLVSDACFSGDIFRGRAESLSPTDFSDMDRYFQEVYQRPSRQAITSGGIEPVVDQGMEGHSVFTYYFLKALKENQERFYDAGQLFERLKIPVANNSDQTPICQPIKDTGDEGGQFIFVRRH